MNRYHWALIAIIALVFAVLAGGTGGQGFAAADCAVLGVCP